MKLFFKNVIILFFLLNSFAFSESIYVINQTYDDSFNKLYYEASKSAIEILKDEFEYSDYEIIEVDENTKLDKSDSIIYFSALQIEDLPSVKANLVSQNDEKSFVFYDYTSELNLYEDSNIDDESDKDYEMYARNYLNFLYGYEEEEEEYSVEDINCVAHFICKSLKSLFPHLEKKEIKKNKPDYITEVNASVYYNSNRDFTSKYLKSIRGLKNGDLVVATVEGVFAYSNTGKYITQLDNQIPKEYISSNAWDVFSLKDDSIVLFNFQSSYVFNFDKNYNYKSRTKYNFSPNTLAYFLNFDNKGNPYSFYNSTLTNFGKDNNENDVSNNYDWSYSILSGPNNNYFVQTYSVMDPSLIYVLDSNNNLERIIVTENDVKSLYSKLCYIFDDESFLVKDDLTKQYIKFDSNGKTIFTISTDNTSFGDYNNGFYYFITADGKVQVYAENGIKLPNYLEENKLFEQYLSNVDKTKKFDYEKYLTLANVYSKNDGYWKAFNLLTKYLDYCPGDLKASETKLLYELELAKEVSNKYKDEAIDLYNEYGEETAKPSYLEAMKLIERFLKFFPNDLELNELKDELKSTFAEDSVVKETKLSDISIEEVLINPIFPSLQNFYSKNPNGSIKIKNNSSKPIENILVSTNIKKYMDYSSESPIVKTLKPKEEITIDLYNNLNDNILSISENVTSQIQINITWNSNKSKEKLSLSRPLTIYEKSAMTWADTGMLSCFILPEDKNIKKMAYEVISSNTNFILSKNLTNAISLINGIRNLNLKYVPDALKPGTLMVDNDFAIDTVKFPSDTLHLKGGDCDDLTTLFCSVLESSGIETALITTPGHIFAAFNTGLTYNQIIQNLSKELLVINIDGYAWIPIETTVINNGFFESWKQASKELDNSVNSFSYNEIILRSDIIEYYPPVNYDMDDLNLKFNSKKLVAAINDDFANLKNLFIYAANNTNVDSANAYELNSLARIYINFDDTEKAVNCLEQAIKIDANYKSAYLNLINIYKKQGNTSAADKLSKQVNKIKNDSTESIKLRASSPTDDWNENDKTKKGIPVRKSTARVGNKTTSNGLRTISTRADDSNDNNWID